MKLARNIQDNLDYLPTFNNMGYMSPSLDQIQLAFVNQSKRNPNGRFLDIGCGFGVATLPLINEGCHVIACDLDERHLKVLKGGIPTEKKSLITLKQGHFPNEICLPENSVDYVNLSMVLHFLPPPIIRKMFTTIFKVLKGGGKLFLTTS
ncbi:MAG: class I SAM-dependent methyltransferase, partial [Alphaproteobacteria bacterium]|nr:class I SAM-dependent methyltransferase [Alphaproteobacteria bacterium]